MGIGSFFRRLVGSEAPVGPLTGATGADLARLWSARETLGPQTRNQTLDELCRRRLPLPFAEVPGIHAPAAMGLDEVLDLASLLELLRAQDPLSGVTSAVRAASTSVLVPCAEDRFVLVVLPSWREGGRAAPAPPALEPGEQVVAVLSLGADADVARRVAAAADAAEAPLHTVSELDAPLRIDELTVSPLADAPGAIELIDDDDVFRVLVGAAIPLRAVLGPPETTHVFGGFSVPPSDADAQALADAEWEPAHACDIEACVLLSDVAGTGGYQSQAVAMALMLPTRTVGSGLPVGAEAQPLLDAVLRGDQAAATELGASLDEGARAEVWHHLLVEGRLDDAAQVVALAPDEPDAAYRRGILAELAGDRERARAACEEAASAEPPHARAVAQLAWLDAGDGDLASARSRAEAAVEALPDDVLAGSNLALCRWLQGERDEAFAMLQASHLTASSWLGPLMETVVHDADPESADFGLYSRAAFELAPYVTALDHLRAGELAEGERLLRRALAIEPRHAAALGQLVLHLDHAGRSAEALALCDESLERLPHFASLRAIRAVLLLRAERIDEAVEDLDRALAAHPDHADWRINRVQALVRLGRIDEARADVALLDEGGTDRVLVASLRRSLDA
ncbi:MAG: tetratricopeptide repeat protein [Deltaproteobacteria bacterium]|nr:tetratricopeptide repeat protein [Deltaproteobacteria bacterium]